MEDEKFVEEMEKNRAEKEKKRKEEQDKLNELNKAKINSIEKIFYKADRQIKAILKKNFEIYYLKSKVMSLKNYEDLPRKCKTIKKGKKRKRKTVCTDTAIIDKVSNLRKIFTVENENEICPEVKSDKEEDNDKDN